MKDEESAGLPMLPQNLGLPVEAMERDTVLGNALGQGFIAQFVEFKRYFA